MSQISRDNCCTCMERILTCRDFADIKVRYEGYGFTLDYEGSDGEYWEEFESMLKLFSEKVIKSYREFKNFVPDSYYKNCFDAMVEDFEIHTCPFGTLVSTRSLLLIIFPGKKTGISGLRSFLTRFSKGGE